MKNSAVLFAVLVTALAAAGAIFRPRAASAAGARKDGAATISVSDGARTVVFALNDSASARSLAEQLPLTVDVENYGGNEKIFYPKPLDVGGAVPLTKGKAGTLAYFAPWKDVVMFCGPAGPYPGLYVLGEAVSGAENISKLNGAITVRADG